MWPLLHDLVVLAYLLAPLVALLVALRGRRRGRSGRLLALLSTLFVGLALGTLLTVYYAHLLQTRPAPKQLFYCVYLASSALLIIRAMDSVLLMIGLRARSRGSLGICLGLRGLLLIALGIPLFMSGLLVYRPKIVSADTPATVLHAEFSPVAIDSSGLTIRGWWIPANRRSPRTGEPRSPTGATVLVCADEAVDKSQVLKLVRPLRGAGFNLLIIDLRGQGGSGGYLTSLGDMERGDVLAAVQWLRSNQGPQCQTILGLGIGTGGAALIAAAADDSPSGQAIESLAVFGVFDDARLMLRDLSATLFARPLNRWMPALVLPMASATVGTDLSRFSPALLVQRIWPRPILIIHAIGDEVVDFDRGRALFEAATFPKQRMWIDKDRGDALDDASTGQAVRDFFLTSRPMRAI